MASINITDYLNKSSKVILSLKNHSKEIIEVAKLIKKAYRSNKTIYACGNGGSDSEAEHFVTELLCTYDNKKSISGIKLGFEFYSTNLLG